MTVCNDCSFVFNAAFDSYLLSYGPEYDNSQFYSSYFSDYLDSLATYLTDKQGVRDSNVVEVGCGKGTFLSRLVENPDYGNFGYGIDPSYVGPLSAYGGRLKFFQRHYGPEFEHLSADVIVCRHVIEHLADPVEFLRSMRVTLSASPHARLFFETPCVEWILRNQVLWDFFYEHCSLFSIKSLSSAFALAGFRVEEVRHVFGEQYLWLEATVANRPSRPPRHINAIPVLTTVFTEGERRLREQWRRLIQNASADGKIALWGAGAKGVTFANLLDQQRDAVDCIVDVNPNKNGHFVPGTGHPIVSPETIIERGIRTCIVMNSNYYEEIQAWSESKGMEIHLLACEDI